MSDETTPRPWENYNPGDGTGRLYGDLGNENEGTPILQCVNGHEGAAYVSKADADLIVTAVNQHDALVAFVEAVRAWDAIFPVSTDVTDALADLDAQIGGN